MPAFLGGAQWHKFATSNVVRQDDGVAAEHIVVVEARRRQRGRVFRAHVEEQIKDPEGARVLLIEMASVRVATQALVSRSLNALRLLLMKVLAIDAALLRCSCTASSPAFDEFPSSLIGEARWSNSLPHVADLSVVS